MYERFHIGKYKTQDISSIFTRITLGIFTSIKFPQILLEVIESHKMHFFPCNLIMHHFIIFNYHHFSYASTLIKFLGLKAVFIFKLATFWHIIILIRIRGGNALIQKLCSRTIFLFFDKGRRSFRKHCQS